MSCVLFNRMFCIPHLDASITLADFYSHGRTRFLNKTIAGVVQRIKCVSCNLPQMQPIAAHSKFFSWFRFRYLEITTWTTLSASQHVSRRPAISNRPMIAVETCSEKNQVCADKDGCRKGGSCSRASRGSLMCWVGFWGGRGMGGG